MWRLLDLHIKFLPYLSGEERIQRQKDIQEVLDTSCPLPLKKRVLKQLSPPTFDLDDDNGHVAAVLSLSSSSNAIQSTLPSRATGYQSAPSLNLSSSINTNESMLLAATMPAPRFPSIFSSIPNDNKLGVQATSSSSIVTPPTISRYPLSFPSPSVVLATPSGSVAAPPTMSGYPLSFPAPAPSVVQQPLVPLVTPAETPSKPSNSNSKNMPPPPPVKSKTKKPLESSVVGDSNRGSVDSTPSSPSFRRLQSSKSSLESSATTLTAALPVTVPDDEHSGLEFSSKLASLMLIPLQSSSVGQLPTSMPPLLLYQSESFPSELEVGLPITRLYESEVDNFIPTFASTAADVVKSWENNVHISGADHINHISSLFDLFVACDIDYAAVGDIPQDFLTFLNRLLGFIFRIPAVFFKDRHESFNQIRLLIVEKFIMGWAVCWDEQWREHGTMYAAAWSWLINLLRDRNVLMDESICRSTYFTTSRVASYYLALTLFGLAHCPSSKHWSCLTNSNDILIGDWNGCSLNTWCHFYRKFIEGTRASGTNTIPERIACFNVLRSLIPTTICQ